MKPFKVFVSNDMEYRLHIEQPVYEDESWYVVAESGDPNQNVDYGTELCAEEVERLLPPILVGRCRELTITSSRLLPKSSGRE